MKATPNKHALVVGILLFSCRQVAAESYHCPLTNLLTEADFVGRVYVTSGISQRYSKSDYKPVVYEARVVERIKGERYGDTIYFGPYAGTRVAWEYIVFLVDRGESIGDLEQEDQADLRQGYPSDARYLTVMCAGYGSMDISNYSMEISPPGEAVLVKTGTVELPEGMESAEASGEERRIVGGRWVRPKTLLDFLRKEVAAKPNRPPQ